MGMIEKTSCPACGQSWEYRTGCGLLHGDMGRIVDLYEEPIAVEIRAYAMQMPPVLYDFGFHPAHCARCRSITSVPVLTIKENGESYIGICQDCGQNVELIQEMERTPCPVCDATALFTMITGEWD